MSLDIARVRERLPDRLIEWHETIDSTMIAASRLAEAGAPSGTVVGAEQQTAGHGRYGRTWHSEAEAGLYVSIVLRYNFAPDELPVVTMTLGLAAVEAIADTTGVVCDLRWPNDILIGGRKCAGILPRLEGQAIVAGFGINVNHARFPQDLKSTATSLRITSGRVQSREDLLVALLGAVDSWCQTLERAGRRAVLDLFSRASSYVHGRKVSIEQGDNVLEGVTAGLNDSGFLLLRDGAGKLHTIVTGGVRPCS